MKPNIFDLATKELTQDVFITWLLQWSDDEVYDKHNKALSQCGKDFVMALMRTVIKDFDQPIASVRAGRQWANIDVWAVVNDEYLIIIEDKTFTKQHSDQLSRYKETAEEWCSHHLSYKTPICIYLKTGNESQKSLGFVKKEGFSVFNRPQFLEILKNHHDVQNDIFNDFKDRLTRLEHLNHQWEGKKIKEWNGNDWQGFFLYLEKQHNIIDWSFVNNRSGGFWSAILKWISWEGYPFFLQSEQNKLCFKISTDPQEVNVPEHVNKSAIRNELSYLILIKAQDNDFLRIKKPDRFGHGKYMTVAVVDGDDWLGSTEEKVNKEEVKNRISAYMALMNDIPGEKE